MSSCRAESAEEGCDSDCDGVSRLALAFILKAGKLKGKGRVEGRGESGRADRRASSIRTAVAM